MSVDRLVNGALLVFSATAVMASAGLLKRMGAGTPKVSAAPVADWHALEAERRRDGPATAAAVAVVFSDVRCPHCLNAWRVLQRMRRLHGTDLSVVYRHYPLAWGVFSSESARATECIAREGRLTELFSVVHSAVDTSTLAANLVRGQWGEAARLSGLTDLGRFNSCMADSSVITLIERDIAVARKVGVAAVPTTFINGVRVAGDDSATLRKVIEHAIESAQRQ